MAATTTAPKKGDGTKKDTAPKKAGAKPKPPRFAPGITDAVKYARTELHAHKPGLGDRRAPAASGGDHEAVRKVIGELIAIGGGDLTPAAVTKLIGLSAAKLEAVARFDTGTDDDLATLRKSPLGEACAGFAVNRAWRTGRYLAGIVSAYLRELKGTK